MYDNDPTAIVQRMFAAFGAGDFDALLATVHSESRWKYYGANPRLSAGEFNGRDEVGRFFEGIVARVEVTAFEPREWVAEGDTVVIFGSESGRVRATGEEFTNVWSQKYVVRENLIVEMEEYNIEVR